MFVVVAGISTWKYDVQHATTDAAKHVTTITTK
jgi:hypothetical protein